MHAKHRTFSETQCLRVMLAVAKRHWYLRPAFCPHMLHFPHKVCAALQLVHCDLKSPNILLKDSSFREAKIADLGLSKYMLENSLLTIQLHGKL